MPKKDPQSPATTSLAYDTMSPRWAKIDALLGGTETMRAAGSEYLPRHPEEGNAAWRERLSVCTLLNMVDMTLTSLVSRPFGTAVKVGEDVPEPLQALTDDVDMQGTSLDRFARNWFKDGVAKGFSAVLVEFPRIKEKPNGAPRTKADDLEENLRPYFVHIRPENIISASASYVDGREVIEEVRIREEVIKKQGYAETVVEQIRVITPGEGRVFEKKRTTQGKIQWVLVEEYTYDLDFIPIVIFYADRQGFMLSKPPLTDLADLNIRHWQSTSDQIAILTVARFPMLAVSGSIDSDTVVVGPNNLLSVTDSAGRFYYVEHTGKAITAGRQDLLDLEEVMAEYGATFLKKRPGGATATARALDSAEVTSALQDMALCFEDALNLAMFYMGKWMGIPDTGTFKVKTDFSLTDNDQQALDNLTEARKNGDLSRSNYLKAMIRYGVLSEDFPIEENDKELEAEAVKSLERLKQEVQVQASAKPPTAKAPVSS